MTPSETASTIVGMIFGALVISTVLPLVAFPILVPRPLSRLNVAWLMFWLATLAPPLAIAATAELVGMVGSLSGEDPRVSVALALSTPACAVIMTGSSALTFMLAQALWLFMAEIGRELVSVVALRWHRTNTTDAG